MTGTFIQKMLRRLLSGLRNVLLDSIGHKGDTKEMGHFMDGLDCKKQRAQDYTGISSLKMRVTSLGN